MSLWPVAVDFSYLDAGNVPTGLDMLCGRGPCYGLNFVPPNPHVEVLTARTSKGDLLWRQVFTAVMKLK